VTHSDETVAWLVTGQGREAIRALTGVDPLRAGSILPGLDRDRLAAALTQARHRPADYPLPLVTVDGVQQASPPEVAIRRAHRVAASGVRTVIDAGCGIGMDAWAFAHAGLQVIAFEVDPPTAQIARVNLAGLDVDLRCEDVTVHPLPDGLLFVDPARRQRHQDSRGRPIRVHDPEQWRPAWSWVMQQVDSGRAVVVRTRPGQRDVPEAAEWHCSSMGRRLVDATAWFPPLAQTGRRASVHDAHGWHELSGPPLAAVTGPASRYIVDPDPAIVRSGLVMNAAAVTRSHLLDDRLAFFTCADPPPSWVGRSMRVIQQVPLKQVRTACRQHGLNSATVWARGFQKVPDIGVPHGQDAIVVAARLGDRRTSTAWIGIPT
jgi:hypothetical protein